MSEDKKKEGALPSDVAAKYKVVGIAVGKVVIAGKGGFRTIDLRTITLAQAEKLVAEKWPHLVPVNKSVSPDGK